ncbi:IS5 family transposase [Calditerrivibrio nitroreducens]|uniref:IS5 family transposase n=1 Tax=Calditerrivibrio nitroreducens TaxID=477976 RepID=UPI000674157F
MAARTKIDERRAKPKYCYREKNWAEYDRALVNRGNLTIGFDEASIAANWTPPRPVGPGKPGLYSDVAIQTCLTLKTLFGLPYRATEGLLKSLMRWCGLNLPVPDHTHMSRRAATLEVKIPRRPRTGATHVVIDSTGLKIFSEGEWKVRQNGFGKRRSWRFIAENMMYRLKQLGDRLFSRTFARQVTEAHVRVAFLDRFTYLGMPQSVRAGQIVSAA